MLRERVSGNDIGTDKIHGLGQSKSQVLVGRRVEWMWALMSPIR
jgi:hypothetical protein